MPPVITNLNVAEKVVEISKSIDEICHSIEDNYMMDLLANITKKIIDKEYITYDSLYSLDEDEIIDIINKIDDKEIKSLFNKFLNIKLKDIEVISLPSVKERRLNPLVNGKRI